jgi:WD40 repeat protein
MNQKTSDGDGSSLLSSIYAPVYKKFVADPVDGISWVKEGVLATVSKRSDRITFHDVERGLMGTSAPTAPTGSSAAALAVASAATTTTTTTISSRAMPTSTQSPSPRFLAYSQGLVVSPVYNVTHPSDIRDTLGITSIASCDDGNRLFAATGVGSVFTFDLRQRVDHTRPVAIFSAPTTGNLNSVNVTNDGQLVCAASSSGRVVLWDARKAVSTHATDHRGFTGIKPDKEMCSWSVSNMFSKIHGRSFASKSEVYWVDFDPKDYSRVAFHCSNGRTGVIDMKQNNHATSSLGVITHAHCPPNPWTSTAPTRITRDEAERFIGAEGAWAYLNGDSAGMATQTETEGAISSQIAKWNGRDKRTCSWSTDGQKLIVPNVNDSGILILDVMANNPKSYQWIDDGTATRESTTVKLWNENDDDAHIDEEEGANEEREDEEDEYYPGYGHKPIAPSLSDQETILSAVAVHPTCDFEYCAGGPNTLSYFRFATRSF